MLCIRRAIEKEEEVGEPRFIEERDKKIEMKLFTIEITYLINRLRMVRFLSRQTCVLIHSLAFQS